MVPYCMYKCTKFTLHKNLITPACFLLYLENLGLLSVTVVRLPDPESVMLCRQYDSELSVDSGYSSCYTLSLGSHVVISTGPAKEEHGNNEVGKHFRLPNTEGTVHYTLHGK